MDQLEIHKTNLITRWDDVDNKELLLEISNKVIKIEVMLENSAAVSSLQIKALETRITKLEKSQEWAWRAFAGGFITGLFGLFFGLMQMK